MATIRKQVLGQLQGGIADIKIKYRNGKPYVASKPGRLIPAKIPLLSSKRTRESLLANYPALFIKLKSLKKSGP